MAQQFRGYVGKKHIPVIGFVKKKGRAGFFDTII
jgi:hypothetical protein